MGDWNIVSNSEFFMLFFTQALIFFVLLYSLHTFEFKIEALFNEKIYFMRSGEKVFRSLNNSIVRRCEIF